MKSATPIQILDFCPNESGITLDGKKAAEMLGAMIDPKQGKSSLEEVHMWLYGHTKFIVHPIEAFESYESYPEEVKRLMETFDEPKGFDEAQSQCEQIRKLGYHAAVDLSGDIIVYQKSK